MRALIQEAERIAARRVSAVIDALGDEASDLAPERLDDGIAIHGPGLVRRLAFDGRLRGLTVALRSMRR